MSSKHYAERERVETYGKLKKITHERLTVDP